MEKILIKERRSYYYSILFGIMIFIGIYFPSSIKGNISNELMLIQYGVVIFMYLIVLIKNKTINYKNIYLSLLINILILTFTIIGMNSKKISMITYGAYLPIFTLSIMYIIDFKNIYYSKYIEYTFITLNIINLFFSLLIIIGNKTILEFFTNNYTIFYEDILIYAFSLFKPVLTFGSHSIASLYMFIFCVLSYISYIKLRKNIHLVATIGYFITLFFMKSNSSYVYLLLLVIIFLFNANSKNRKFLLLGFLIIITILISMGYLDTYIQNIESIITNKNNGFSSRYFNSDIFNANYEYIAKNFFLPIGIGYNENLYFTDNGPLIYMLRGGVVLVFSIYYGLYSFLKYNLINNKYVFYSFIILFSFEFAYNNFNFIRTFYIIPFCIVYLNYIEYKYNK